MKINNIITNVLLKFPLLAALIENIEFKYSNDNSIPAPAYTDGKTIYYNDKFINDYNDGEKVFIICHELFHILLKHIFRNIGKDTDLLNYVEDAIINQFLIKAGLVMPKDVVYIEDALDYSVDELYMKYLSKIDEIKEWMGANTYHVVISVSCDGLEGIFSNSNNLNEDMQSFLDANEGLGGEIFKDFKDELKGKALASKSSLGCEVDIVGSLGRAKPMLSWQDLLEQTIVSPEDSVVSFFEIQRDGIIKKEVKDTESYSECEIIIDSSGSMSLDKIKAILRECKNILSFSHIKVGFCDCSFYRWIEISSEKDIDNIKIIGRGGTSFATMAKSFSKDADNKIVITDGFDEFPNGYPDVIWLVINYYNNLSYYEQIAIKNGVNIIHINESDVPTSNKQKVLSYYN